MPTPAGDRPSSSPRETRAARDSTAPGSRAPEPASLIDDAVRLAATLPARAPRVHCITNTVAQAFTANVLLALGAVPSMTTAPDEIGAFVAGADALMINLGTLDAERRAAITVAADAARARRIPVVLDPVFIDRVAPRAALARELLAGTPRALRLNAAEFMTLADDPALAAADAPARAAAAQAFAATHHTVVALTGATDIVADATRVAQLSNGHPLMGRITAMGCAASAMVAAACAVEPDPWCATAAALMLYGVAGERAGRTAAGPGSLAVHILDELARLDRVALAEARVTLHA